MRSTSLPSFRRLLVLAAQLALLVACQSATRVKMVEIEENLHEVNEVGSPIQISEKKSPTPVQELDVIEKSDNLWDRLHTQFQLEKHYENSAVDKELAALESASGRLNVLIKFIERPKAEEEPKKEKK